MLTTHTGDGVSLTIARRAARGGQQGNSVGSYRTGLVCSLYVHGKKEVGSGERLHGSLALTEKVERTTTNLTGFLNKVVG